MVVETRDVLFIFFLSRSSFEVIELAIFLENPMKSCQGNVFRFIETDRIQRFLTNIKEKKEENPTTRKAFKNSSAKFSSIVVISP